MGLRYRRSKKILPGVRLNINKNSIGVTLGGKGLRYTVNSKGKKTATVGIPGTGISYSKSTTVKKEGNDTNEVQNQVRTATPICELCKASNKSATIVAVVTGLLAICAAFSTPGFVNLILFILFVSIFYTSMLSRDTVNTAKRIVKIHPEVSEGTLEPASAEDALIIIYRGTKWRTLLFLISSLSFLIFCCVAAELNSSGGAGSGYYIAKGSALLFFGAKSLYDRLTTSQAKKKLKKALATK